MSRAPRRRRAATTSDPAASRALRCAIYTRKSTDEGLDQEFNSLDAQRESAEAFVQSQRGEGWEILPDRYDDGGFSGGNMERPALRRLLADIDEGRVDAVVVYKVDRLSRSLLDFARIMDRFNEREIAFVSVTQQFNTATSMGRLVLHILLSFAQFEREMIAERTRDKMSAARRKGKWVGGVPFLGYDVAPKGGRLLVNDAEAAMVREIYEFYLREESVLATVRALNERGWRTKSWTTRKGRERQGGAFTKSNLRGMLSNASYVGKVNYHGETFEGEHDAIVDEETWTQVQRLLRKNARTRSGTTRNKHGALLKGLLRCAPCDAAMVHSYTTKGSRRYRYYVCSRAQKEGWTRCPTRGIPAGEIERYMVEQIRRIGADPALVRATLEGARADLEESRRVSEAERGVLQQEQRRLTARMRKSSGDPTGAADRMAPLQDRLAEIERALIALHERETRSGALTIDEEDLAAALVHFDPVWDELFPREQARVLRLLVQRVDYDGGGGTIRFTFRPTGIRALAEELEPAGEEATR
jgi:site-specific DNA recombinase